MMRNFPSVHPMHPIHSARPVDARWCRITEIADSGIRATHKLDDDWIKRGWRYVKQLRACRNQQDRERLTLDMPDLDAAYRLHTTDNKMERAVVEARLLARQTIEEVAAACGLSVDAVLAYEKIYFQVIGRLEAFAFILWHAIRVEPMFVGLHEEDTDILLKLFAYKKGPLYMEMMLRYLTHGVRVPDRLDQATRADLEELVAMLQCRAVVLAYVLPFPKCQRALVILELAREIEACIPSLTRNLAIEQAFTEIIEAKGVPSVAVIIAPKPANPLGLAGLAPCWPAIREAVQAA